MIDPLCWLCDALLAMRPYHSLLSRRVFTMISSNETEIRLRSVALCALCFIAMVATADAQQNSIGIGGGGGVQWTMKGTLALPRTRDWDDFDCRFNWKMPGSLIGYTFHADVILPNLFFHDSLALLVRVGGASMSGRGSYRPDSREVLSVYWDHRGGDVRTSYSLGLVSLDLLMQYPFAQRFLLRAGPSLGYLYSVSGDVMRIRHPMGRDGRPSAENVEIRRVYSGDWRGEDLTVGASAMIALREPVGAGLMLVPEIGIRWEMNTLQGNSKLWPELGMQTGISLIYMVHVDEPGELDVPPAEPSLP